ncbi:MAG: TldD/PmbA family protein [Gammaproteobacteria bacterium]|nr:TldD/PmbA family protein [Gammaproteobacteria bacterium]
MQDPIGYSLQRMQERGFDKAQVLRDDHEKAELQIEFNQPSLLRSAKNTALMLTGVTQDKEGTLSVNRQTAQAIDEAVDALWESALASLPDPANDIAKAQPAQSFTSGEREPDLATMYDRLDEFLVHCGQHYPSVTLGSFNISHVRSVRTIANSNGVSLKSERGYYSVMSMFTAKEGTDVSSFNFTAVSLANLNRPIARTATVERLLKSAVEQIRTRKIPHKFTGALIITPDCLGAFIAFLLDSISGPPLIAKTSKYRDKLGTQVAYPGLSIRTEPLDRPGGFHLTDDGYPATNDTIVEKGVLKTFLLNHYASRKLAMPRVSTGAVYVVDSGDVSFAQMVSGVDEGVIIGRFSGGQPNANGDFSGVAKNSYYVKDGEIQYPIAETMVSGNMVDLLLNINAISRERADFGTQSYPWIRTRGVVVS